jgi:hypothetical protein
MAKPDKCVNCAGLETRIEELVMARNADRAALGKEIVELVHQLHETEEALRVKSRELDEAKTIPYNLSNAVKNLQGMMTSYGWYF